MTRNKLTKQEKEWGEIQWAFASDLKAQLTRPLPNSPEAFMFAKAVRAQWPDSHASYLRMIVRRYLCYDFAPAEVVSAIGRGFSSPTAAMAANALPRRKMVRRIEEIA